VFGVNLPSCSYSSHAMCACLCRMVAQIGARAPNLSGDLFHVRKITIVQVMGLCGRRQPVRRLSALEHSNTNLFWFFILPVLHCIIYMAYHRLQRICVCEIEREERHQRVVLNLGCDTASAHAQGGRQHLAIGAHGVIKLNTHQLYNGLIQSMKTRVRNIRILSTTSGQ
jgi:hypothetical protein